MCYSDTKTGPRPIAEIVREMTNDGELIVRFLVDMIVGNIEGANHWHRLEATRQLERLGLELPNVVKQAISPPANGHKPVRAPGKPQPKDDLADIIREETDGGRDIVRFLIDAMQGKLEDFKPRHRLSASDRLITRGWDNFPGHTVAAGEDHDRYNAEDAPFDFENYTIDDFARDRNGTRALFHIFGGKDAKKAASDAYYRWDSETELDYDRSPIENPGDDPFGKGCYGYKVLAINYGDNEGIRIANKAALEFHREKYKHLLNEDGSLSALADTSSLDPKTLQYLKRNRHLLAEKDDPPEDTSPPLPAGEGWSLPRTRYGGEGETPIGTRPSNPSLPAKSRVTQNPSIGKGFKPSREYEHCRDCSVTVGEAFQRSGDPDKPPAERDSERPHDTPVGEGFKPSRDPEKPPAPPPRKTRPIIHLGPTSEDPLDDHPRQRGDPDEIRVPLEDLLSISAGPL